MTVYLRTVAGVVGSGALALTLSACKLENRPLFGRDGDAAAYDAAPALGPLDPAYAETALGPTEAYAYPEHAFAVGRAAADRAPSSGFVYEDARPWAWDLADDGLMFAEPHGDDWRYYYYEPGEAYPYYVQDADYGYAYGDGGVLLAMFTAAGALIAADRYDDYHHRAGDYWTRGLDLNRSYRHAPRYAVEETVWRSRAPVVFADYDRRYRAFATQPGWREAVRRDNGRHLGWRKDRGDRAASRRVTVAAPPRSPVGAGEVRDDDRRRAGRQAQHARVESDLRRREQPASPAARGSQQTERGRQDPDRGHDQARAKGPDGHGRDRDETKKAQARQQTRVQGPQAPSAGSNGHDAGWKGRGDERGDGGGNGGGGHGGGHGKGR